ncbi:MAG: Gfo/Idh/MocA family protein [Planctomycetota bacterium]|jgi:predicted dehydrogenase
MINVGIAGLGFMGMTHYNAYQRVAGAQVTAICETDPERLAGDWRSIKGNFGPQGEIVNLDRIAKYSEIERMLADPEIDMVDVCLPPSLHAAASTAASKAGKHVLCEKAIALRPEDAVDMVEAAKAAGKQFMIAHVLPFVPEYDFAYGKIISGEYGRLLGGHFKRIISDPLWLKDFYEPDGCGGPMVDLHIHDAHFVRLICGMPKAVHSVGRMRGEVAEFFNTQFLFDDPNLVVTAVSGVINQQGRPFTHGYEIQLEKATLLFESFTETPLTLLDDEGNVVRPELGSPDMLDAFPLELEEAVRCVETDTPSKLLDGELARDALILGHKQTQSIVERKTVEV